MAQSLNKTLGLTLIEVLIALAIFSIALTALIKSTSQNIKDTAYLENKMIANWVGLKIMNEARVGFLNLPSQSEKLTEDVETLGKQWTWEASSKGTENPRISEIIVAVYKDPEHIQFANLISYAYVLKPIS